ncbi:MAG: polysaccharide biosynthesis/export family protein, partial [Deltaproteobacteria bacterium]|nr:polysaccharide biosynthesis/export family protein [Deltaproteobacteria bacterium]
CYTRALELYRDKNYPAAKSLFEQIIAIDVNYKAASRYLKKTENQLAKIKAEPQKEASKQQKGDEDFFDRQKDEMEEAGRVPLETEIPAEAVYRIDVGDILSVSVWRNEDLDKNVVVRPDGVISYPLVGDVPAVGLTLVELDNQLTAALTEFIRNPVVSVAVERFGGVKVIALGEVAGQGILSLPGGGTVIDVIALSGGFTRDAVRRSTFLIRGGMKNPQVYRLNLARIFKGDLSQNVAIQSNDIIYVPKTFIAHFNDAINRVSPLLSNMLLGTSVGRDLGLLDR